MTVKQLIKKLVKCEDQKAKVVVYVQTGTGCETCGYGSHEYQEVVDVVGLSGAGTVELEYE